jgi:hypothetical protein
VGEYEPNVFKYRVSEPWVVVGSAVQESYACELRKARTT